MRLEYALDLNTFTDETTESGVPPPRATESISSDAVVPDGYTIIVGGLRGTALTETVRKIPLLGDLPLLGWLFRSTTRNADTVTTFVFLRPVILRDRQFEALKYMSAEDAAEAEVQSDFPESDPKTMWRRS